MNTARIINIISNRYTLLYEGEPIIAQARGKMRLKNAPVVGDMVEFKIENGQAVIHKILPRKNRLLRPPVSNIDEALIITSLIDPDFNAHLLNRLIFMVSLCGIEPVICFTKWDRLSDEQKHEYSRMMNNYRKMGYKVFVSHPGSQDTLLKQNFKDKILVLCGQSGSGKSSLLNRLDPQLNLETQEISKALGRGKHTTRASTLYSLEEGWIADTPGFSSLDFSQIDLKDFDKVLKPFQPYIGECKFNDCRHNKEPGCAVKEAVENGKIDRQFYQDYLSILENPQLTVESYMKTRR